MLEQLAAQFPQCEFVDGREQQGLERHLASASVTYGVPPVSRLSEATSLKWIQLMSAGVPRELCPPAKERSILVTNLAGLYGPSIAEHAVALMLMLLRNLHAAIRNQREHKWERSVAQTMADLHGKTLAVVGLGNIGQSIARLGRPHGMRVLGCRRTGRATAVADRVYPLDQLNDMLAEADVVAVAAPLTAHTEGMLGRAQFAAMKQGVIYVNVS